MFSCCSCCSVDIPRSLRLSEYSEHSSSDRSDGISMNSYSGFSIIGGLNMCKKSPDCALVMVSSACLTSSSDFSMVDLSERIFWRAVRSELSVLPTSKLPVRKARVLRSKLSVCTSNFLTNFGGCGGSGAGIFKMLISIDVSYVIK